LTNIVQITAEDDIAVKRHEFFPNMFLVSREKKETSLLPLSVLPPGLDLKIENLYCDLFHSDLISKLKVPPFVSHDN